jgi:hypothetical protein
MTSPNHRCLFNIMFAQLTIPNRYPQHTAQTAQEVHALHLTANLQRQPNRVRQGTNSVTPPYPCRIMLGRRCRVAVRCGGWITLCMLAHDSAFGTSTGHSFTGGPRSPQHQLAHPSAVRRKRWIPESDPPPPPFSLRQRQHRPSYVNSELAKPFQSA